MKKEKIRSRKARSPHAPKLERKGFRLKPSPSQNYLIDKKN